MSLDLEGDAKTILESQVGENNTWKFFEMFDFIVVSIDAAWDKSFFLGLPFSRLYEAVYRCEAYSDIFHLRGGGF